MPVRAELLPLYPGRSIRSPEWRALREEALEHAGWCCEFCGVEHCRRIWRLDAGGAFMTNAGGVYCDRTGQFLRQSSPGMELARPVIVYLAVCHKDHDPTNNDPENLLVLCQQCHLRHDVEHHRQTKRSKKALGDLFQEPAP